MSGCSSKADRAGRQLSADSHCLAVFQHENPRRIRCCSKSAPISPRRVQRSAACRMRRLSALVKCRRRKQAQIKALEPQTHHGAQQPADVVAGCTQHRMQRIAGLPPQPAPVHPVGWTGATRSKTIQSICAVSASRTPSRASRLCFLPTTCVACTDHLRLVQEPLASRAVLQVDQATPAHQALPGHFREYGKKTQIWCAVATYVLIAYMVATRSRSPTKAKARRYYFDSSLALCVAEKQGFEPWIRRNRIPDFESGAFDHSATSPVSVSRGAKLSILTEVRA